MEINNARNFDIDKLKQFQGKPLDKAEKALEKTETKINKLENKGVKELKDKLNQVKPGNIDPNSLDFSNKVTVMSDKPSNDSLSPEEMKGNNSSNQQSAQNAESSSKNQHLANESNNSQSNNNSSQAVDDKK